MSLSRPSFFDKNLFLLVHIKGLLTRGFGKKYYGQWAEDVVLERLFAKQEKGLYVDVGAYHPFHYSNTYALYARGWRGINIDANPESIRLFNWHRTRDINLNYGVSEEADTKPYFIFNHQSCNTFSPAQRDLMLTKKFIKLVRETQVPCVPLRTILKEHALGVAVDLLNVDVEGMGLEVLRSLDWSVTRPRVVCIEDDEFDFSRAPGFGSEIFSFLSGKSYTLYSKTGPTCIYTRIER